MADPEADPSQPSPLTALPVRAWFLGERIDDRLLQRGEVVDTAPLTFRVGDGGHAVVFRFGATVFLGTETAEERTFLDSLAPAVKGAFANPETEAVEIHVVPDEREHLGPDGEIRLREASVGRLQVVALVLAKSTVLSHYEYRVTSVFDRVEELARRLQRGLRRLRGRDLLREIGEVLRIQTSTVGRVEIAEKPELTWEDAELDRLYERLAAEYELRERDHALTRKLQLIGGSAETYLDILHSVRSLRVEWYIVILIVVEIALSLYDIFGRG